MAKLGPHPTRRSSLQIMLGPTLGKPERAKLKRSLRPALPGSSRSTWSPVTSTATGSLQGSISSMQQAGCLHAPSGALCSTELNRTQAGRLHQKGSMHGADSKRCVLVLWHASKGAANSHVLLGGTPGKVIHRPPPDLDCTERGRHLSMQAGKEPRGRQSSCLIACYAQGMSY